MVLGPCYGLVGHSQCCKMHPPLGTQYPSWMYLSRIGKDRILRCHTEALTSAKPWTTSQIVQAQGVQRRRSPRIACHGVLGFGFLPGLIEDEQLVLHHVASQLWKRFSFCYSAGRGMSPFFTCWSAGIAAIRLLPIVEDDDYNFVNLPKADYNGNIRHGILNKYQLCVVKLQVQPVRIRSIEWSSYLCRLSKWVGTIDHSKMDGFRFKESEILYMAHMFGTNSCELSSVVINNISPTLYGHTYRYLLIDWLIDWLILILILIRLLKPFEPFPCSLIDSARHIIDYPWLF